MPRVIGIDLGTTNLRDESRSFSNGEAAGFNRQIQNTPETSPSFGS